MGRRADLMCPSRRYCPGDTRTGRLRASRCVSHGHRATFSRRDHYAAYDFYAYAFARRIIEREGGLYIRKKTRLFTINWPEKGRLTGETQH